ncbi:hypothetical protein HA051_08235 [Chromobacterium vaccinii]|nr:hypothetical protein [Chromobacterium vaccinii]
MNKKNSIDKKGEQVSPAHILKECTLFERRYGWILDEVVAADYPEGFDFYKNVSDLLERANIDVSRKDIDFDVTVDEQYGRELRFFWADWGGLFSRVKEWEVFFEILKEKKDAAGAMYALVYLSDRFNTTSTSFNGGATLKAAEVVFDMQLYKRGLLDVDYAKFSSMMEDVSGFGGELSGLAKKQEEVYQKAQAIDVDLNKSIAEWSSSIDVMKDELGEVKSNFQQWTKDKFSQVVDELNVFREQEQKKLELIGKAYEVDKALNAPGVYWESKRRKHHLLARLFGWVVGFAMIVVFLGLFIAVKGVSDSYQSSMLYKQGSVASQVGTASGSKGIVASGVDVKALAYDGWHFDLAKLILLATLGFWAIRILVRIMLSHIHLENDAAERVVMMRTYVVLIRRGGFVPDDDSMKTVLTALFRPSGDGIVKDEGMQLSLMELLTKVK